VSYIFTFCCLSKGPLNVCVCVCACVRSCVRACVCVCVCVLSFTCCHWVDQGYGNIRPTVHVVACVIFRSLCGCLMCRCCVAVPRNREWSTPIFPGLNFYFLSMHVQIHVHSHSSGHFLHFEGKSSSYLFVASVVIPSPIFFVKYAIEIEIQTDRHTGRSVYHVSIALHDKNLLAFWNS